MPIKAHNIYDIWGSLVPDIMLVLCDEFAGSNVSSIVYITGDEEYKQHTTWSQYFLSLAGHLGIPVVAWNADSSGLEQVSLSLLIFFLI